MEMQSSHRAGIGRWSLCSKAAFPESQFHSDPAVILLGITVLNFPSCKWQTYTRTWVFVVASSPHLDKQAFGGAQVVTGTEEN